MFSYKLHSRLWNVTNLWQESRLCFDHERLPDAFQTLQAGRDIMANEHLRRALEIYNTVIQRRFAAEFNDPADKTNFFAFLLQGMLPPPGGTITRHNYAGINARPQINIADPFGIASTPDITPEERGFINQTQKVWVENPGINLPGEVIERNIRKYLEWKGKLDTILQRNAILRPSTQSVNAPGGDRYISRNEYFNLLVLISRGGVYEEQIAKAASAPGAGTESLRKYLASLGDADRTLLSRYNTTRNDVTLDYLGPAEFLSRFGIALGPFVVNAYIESRRNGNPNAPNAALWEENPWLAHPFLMSTGFRNLPGNQHFLEALEYHYDPTFHKRLAHIPEDERRDRYSHGMSRDDVKTILSSIAQELMIYDRSRAEEAEKLVKLRTQLTLAQSTEKFASDVGRFVFTEFDQHKLASVVVGVAGFLAIRRAYRWFFRDTHWRFMRWGGAALLGGVAYGLYQQHRTGEAWWDPYVKRAQEGLKTEMGLGPRDRTLASYWARECGITEPQKVNCLSIMEELPIADMLNWYRAKRLERGGGPRAQVPPSLRMAMSRYRNLFGSLPNEQIETLFYDSLHSFLENRGRAFRTGGWMLTPRGGETDDASVGEHFIRGMFVEHQSFEYLAMEILQNVEITYEGTRIRGEGIMKFLAEPKVQEELRRVLGPDLYFNLLVCRYIVQQRTEVASTSNWQMYYVFAFLMDQGAAARSIGPASILGQIGYRAQEMEQYLAKRLSPPSPVALPGGPPIAPVVTPAVPPVSPIATPGAPSIVPIVIPGAPGMTPIIIPAPVIPPVAAPGTPGVPPVAPPATPGVPPVAPPATPPTVPPSVPGVPPVAPPPAPGVPPVIPPGIPGIPPAPFLGI